MERQQVLVIQEGNRLKLTSKPFLGEWLLDKTKGEAWFTLRKLYSAFSFMKGKFGLVVDKRFALPINPYSPYSPEQLENLTELNRRAKQAEEMTSGQADRQSRNNVMAYGLTAAVSGMVVIIIILALLVASGRLSQ